MTIGIPDMRQAVAIRLAAGKVLHKTISTPSRLNFLAKRID
jgi:hypothetical protein